MPRKQKRPTIQVKPGDYVLMGMPGVSMPGDWHIGTVLWADGGDVLVRQHGIGGNNPHLMLHEIDYIRAVGTIDDLAAFRQRSAEAVADTWRYVHECEAELGRARKAVWAKLDEIAAQAEMATTD